MGILTNSLSGNLSVRTLSVFKLDPLLLVPIEPITDITPGYSGNRVTIDVIEGESYGQSYNVTQNALQDFSFASTHIHRNPRTITVSGVMAGVKQFQANVIGSVLLVAVPDVTSSRADQTRFTNLKKLADSLLPVGVYTPRHAFPVCAITNLNAEWDPSTGENTRVSISFQEINIVSPLTGSFVSDYDAAIVGNNAVQGGGQQTLSDAQFSTEVAANIAGGF